MTAKVECHCCKMPRLYFDDFGYICSECTDVHCTGCLEYDETVCKKCRKKTKR